MEHVEFQLHDHIEIHITKGAWSVLLSSVPQSPHGSAQRLQVPAVSCRESAVVVFSRPSSCERTIKVMWFENKHPNGMGLWRFLVRFPLSPSASGDLGYNTLVGLID